MLTIPGVAYLIPNDEVRGALRICVGKYVLMGRSESSSA